uniref:Uncharacterized protein n=1 Tax=Anguilla anguilla TaxID=7936 RepID=A0A0E9RPV4_ANGAN
MFLGNLLINVNVHLGKP